jgi:hypothetical protein
LDFLKLPRRIANSVSSRYETRRWKAFERRKLHRLEAFSGQPKGPIFVFGCQRSGTTHIERLFRADPRSRVFGEFSELSTTPSHTVWMDLPSMQAVLDDMRGEYWVIRSLLASHHARDVLEAWPDGVALWAYRDANDVVASMMNKWPGNFRAISQGVETDEEGRWELRELWDRIEVEAAELGATGQARTRDEYGLFWYYRNLLALDLDLANHPRVLMTDYRDFTRAPDAWLERILEMAGVEAASKRYPLETRAASARSSAKPRFSPPLQERCDRLMNDLKVAGQGSRDRVAARP